MLQRSNVLVCGLLIWSLSVTAFAISGPYVGVQSESRYLKSKYTTFSTGQTTLSGDKLAHAVQGFVGFELDIVGGLYVALEAQHDLHGKSLKKVTPNEREVFDVNDKYGLLGLVGFQPDARNLFFVSAGVGMNTLHTKIDQVSKKFHEGDFEVGLSYERLFSSSLGLRVAYNAAFLDAKRVFGGSEHGSFKSLAHSVNLGLIYHL